ncbi:hypothetical protein N7532_000689 [Penicillium argentinense]|uniref:Zn(2)-C6 fungal-type domain-containing protein n=1 Tax=Penicillium argentinense TaxID=1131581 RepID=A0A9W9G5Q0_9EURO|nr:uncharacterized protein N7532_000689 [Penicillium argentinense]KAJ5112644.1 hypothetical protein N7532_000689 [Penicillium argentinense]
MPFYGRPSKSCESCRDRRIKCDRIEPVCSQCKRAGKSCGGYRDIPAFLFRNENDKTAHRSAVAKFKSEARRRLLDETPPVIYHPPRIKQRPPQSSLVVQRIPRVLHIPQIPAAVPSSMEEQGLKFFFNQFATKGEEIRHSPFFSEIHSLSWKASPLIASISTEISLRNAVMAVGLAAMSNVTRDRAMQLAAREKYVETINFVRAAVENPEQSKPDLIFKIIAMLSLFEMVSCQSSQVDSWIVHLDGLAALLKQDHFKTVIKTLSARPQIQYYCVSVVKYFLLQGDIPSDLLEWSPNKISSVKPDEQPAVNLIDILVRFTKIHHTLRHIADDQCATDALPIVLSLETELREWERTLPDQWSFSVKESPSLQHTFNGKYLACKDAWASRILNHFFWVRLITNEMILTQLARAKYPGSSSLRHQQRALETIACMATCICAAAASQMSLFQDGASANVPQNPPPLNGIFMLFFPLSVAGGAATAPVEVHQWVIQTLQKIGNTMGIQRALEVIPHLKITRPDELYPYLHAR